MTTGSMEELWRLGDKEPLFLLRDDDLQRVAESYRHLIEVICEGDQVYGVHTDFGFNIKDTSNKPWKEHQKDLLGFLTVGVGDPLDVSTVRRALRLQAMKAGTGISGLSPETYKRLVELCNSDRLPDVPRHGSLGASGDLIPMAHCVTPIFADFDPAGPRDVLALVNTNAIMSSYAVDQYWRVSRLVSTTTEIVALISLALGVVDSFFSSDAFRFNPLNKGIVKAGQAINDSRMTVLSQVGLGFRHVAGVPLQERYSVRCSPQVLGNAMDIFAFVEAKIVAEALSVADNPVVLLNEEAKPYVQHGGLFYAAGIGTACDGMSDVLGKICEMVDRQVLLLMDPELSHGLPTNLEWGEDLHVKGIHQLVSALMQTIRAYSIPSRAMSFSCEGNNQDIVPCGMSALNSLDEMLDKAEELIRAAHFVATRAFALRYLEKLPETLQLRNWPDYARQPEMADSLSQG
jgi:histidine ammonia-lyase/tyrosine ammonia-lyase